MKKRILASTMASVMALSAAGTTLVSSAAVADFKNEFVTKSELQKFLNEKEIKDLVDGGIDNYGSVSGENFQKAIDFANAVVEDVDATDNDATVAFQMVKAAKAALVHYNKTQLASLVEELRGKYNSNNELNEDDAIYKEEDWDNFVAAFTTADDAKESDDLLETTDAYEELYKYRNPKELATVTKNQIEKARKDYIKALEMEYDYQPWQRGTVTASGTDYNGLQFAWGALYAHIASGETDVMAAYEDFTEIKGRTITSNPTIVAAVDAMNQAVKVLTGFSSKLDSASSKKNVTDLLAKYHGQLVYTYKADLAIELANSFITAAEAAVDAKGNAGIAKFTVESKSTTVTGTVTAADEFWNASFSASKEYKPLGSNGKNATANAVADSTADSGFTLASNLNGKEYTFKGKKLIGAEIVITSTAPVYYIVDKSTAGKLENNKNRIVPISGDIGVDAVWFTEDKALADRAATSTKEVKTLNANQNFTISDLIEVSPDDILDTLASSVSVDEAATVFDASKDAISTLATGDMTTDLNALSTAVDTANALSWTVTTDAGVDGNVTQEVKDAATTAIGDLKSAVDALKSKVTALGTTVNHEKINEVADDYAALADLVAAVASAANGTNVPAASKTAMTTAISTPKGTCDTTYGSGAGKFGALVAAYDRVYSAKLSAQLIDVTMAHRNEVYDKTAEVKFKTGGTPAKTNKGIIFVPSGSGESSFDLSTAYVSDRTANNTTTVSLGVALTLYKEFVASTTNQTGSDQLDNISFLSSMEVGKNYPKAWRLLYNYMKYALADEFDASASKTYKKSDIEKLKAQAEDLLDTCVVTELFNDSTNALAINVNVASEWLKLARADGNRNYKDNDTKYNFDYAKKGGAMNGAEDLDSTAMYNALNDTYSQLNKELSAFKYSYDDIVKKMASIAKELDGTKFDASTKAKLTEDLQKTAEAFVKVEAVKLSAGSDLDDSELFNDDGTMNKNNRLFTNESEFNGLYCNDTHTAEKIAKSKSGDNQTHYDMQVAYEKLVKDYTEATEAPVSQVTTDVDGNGKFEIADVSALLKLYVDNKTEVAKHDFNGDKAVNLQDVITLLKAWTET